MQEIHSGQMPFNKLKNNLVTRALPEQVDVVFVCRNLDPEVNNYRMDEALEWIHRGLARELIMVHNSNTFAEAAHFSFMAERMAWDSVLLVTENYHMPRAFLTFLPACKKHNVRLYTYSLANFGLDRSESEAFKIEMYGLHLASYEEAEEYLYGD